MLVSIEYIDIGLLSSTFLDILSVCLSQVGLLTIQLNISLNNYPDHVRDNNVKRKRINAEQPLSFMDHTGMNYGLK